MGTSDWYARKLRGDAKPTPYREQPASVPPPVQHRQFQPSPPPSKGCPECGSVNYTSMGKIPSGAHAGERLPPRCFDCGYGLSQTNSTQGLPAPGGETTAAVQVPGAGYQPSTIVGRVE